MTTETKEQLTLLHEDYKHYCNMHDNCENCPLNDSEWSCFTSFAYLYGIDKITITHKISFEDKGV